jgi:hypothetical protein
MSAAAPRADSCSSFLPISYKKGKQQSEPSEAPREQVDDCPRSLFLLTVEVGQSSESDGVTVRAGLVTVTLPPGTVPNERIRL